jgi:hypothetical protein
MSRIRSAFSLNGFRGLNTVSNTAIQPNEFSDGRNFVIGKDGYVERSKGSRKVFSGWSISQLEDLYYHDDQTDYLLAFGDTGTLEFYTSGAWNQASRGVLITSDIAAGATSIPVADPTLFRVGDSVEVQDSDNAETATVSAIGSTAITVGALTNAYTAANLAFVTNNTTRAKDNMHFGQLADFSSYLKNPVWANGSEFFWLSTSNSPLATGAKTALSFDDWNKNYFLNNGGSVDNYVSVIGNSVAVQHSRMWLSGAGEHSNIVMFSQQFNRTFYDIGLGNLPFLQYVNVGGDESGVGSTEDEIIAIRAVGDSVLVLKGKSVHQIIGKTAIQFDSIQLTDSVGCTSKRSVITTKRGVIWFGDQGIWLFNGSQLQQISNPRVESIVQRYVNTGHRITASYINDRFYYLSLDTSLGLEKTGISLRYDLDLDVWSIEDVGYVATTDKVNKNYAISYDGSDILELEYGYTREADEDGDNGDNYDFEIQTPFIDVGNNAAEKVFYEVALFAKSAENKIPLEYSIDGINDRSQDASFDSRPLFNHAYFSGMGNAPTTVRNYKSAEFDTIPYYKMLYDLDIASTGYSISLAVRKETEHNIRIKEIVVYYNVRRSYREEKR